MSANSTQHGSIDVINSNVIEGWFFEEGVVDSCVSLYINNIKTFDVYATVVRDDICKVFNLDTSVKTGFIIKHTTPLSTKDYIVLKFNTTQKEISLGTDNTLPSTIECVKTDFLNLYLKDVVKYTVVAELITTCNCDILVVSRPVCQRVIKHLQYVVYSNKLTASASCDDAIYIRKEALDCVCVTPSFDDFILQTIINGWSHKTIYNTQAFVFNFYTNTIENASKNCFNFWHKSCERLSQENNKNILFLLSTQDGGTPLTNNDLMVAIKESYNSYVLRCDSKNLYFSKIIHGVVIDIEQVCLIETIKPVSHTSHEYDMYFINILYKYKIDIVHIRHICWHSLTLHKATKFFNLPVVYSMHDYYAICPSHNLLDENLKYCGGACTAGGRYSKCSTVLWVDKDTPPIKHCFINHWKTMFNTFLQQCDVFVTTSVITRDIYIKNYTILQNKINVIPHGRDLLFVDYKSTITTNVIKVVIPGILAAHKGLEFILQLKQLDVNNNIKITFIGPYVKALEGVGEFYGEYNRDSIQTIINDISPHIALIPSIWPETYCHVLTEMWSCNIPTIVLNYGAQAERTRKTNNGWVFEHDPTLVYNFLQEILKSPNILNEKKINFNNTSCKKMAQKYKKIYLQLAKN